MAETFTPAWLAGDPRATSLLPLAFRDAAARANAIAQARAAHPEGPDPRVLEALAHATGPLSEAQEASLRALRGGALAVVTGQQVGLYLGPLYTLHKAASAVAVAKKLAAESDAPVVPVFWLQTEDADFEEVRTCTLPGSDREPLVTLALAPDEGEPSRVSLAHRVLGEEITALNTRLAEALTGPHAAEVMDLVERHYRPGRTLGAAMGGLVAELFAEHGLLVLDPRSPALAPLAAAVHRRAITEAAAIDEALQARARALEAAGFEVQVPIRRGLALSCYHPDGALGPRYRLGLPERAGAPWRLPGTERTVDEAELARALETEPLRFSTTALLRPILQDTLLPTVAYVGGPGEIAYWAQLPPLYAHFGLPLPLVVPRARVRLVTATARRLAEALGGTIDTPLAALRARLAAGRPELAPVDEAMRQAHEALTAALATAGAAAESLEDQAFSKLAKKTEEQARQGLDKLVERLRQRALERDALQVGRLARLEATLSPSGLPQERVLSFPAFAAQVGVAGLVERVLASVESDAAEALIDPRPRDLAL